MVGATLNRQSRRCEATSILQHQGFLGSKTAQVDFCPAITDRGHIFIDRRAINRGQLLNKVSGTAHAEPGDVAPAIGVDRLWPYFFSGRILSRSRLPRRLWR